MRRSALGAILLVLICASHVFGAKEEDPDWLKGITPAGEPRVDMILASSGRPGLFEKLTLSHQLRFDGLQYRSRLSIVELDSRLIPKGEAHYEWRTPTGKIILINAGSETSTTPGNWKVVKNVGEGETAVVGGMKEVYVYRRSKLIEYEKAGVRYFFNLKDGVSEVLNRRGVVLIRLIEGKDGSRVLTAFGSTITLHRGEDGELRRCAGGDWDELEFFYESKLLTGFRRLGEDRQSFAWGAVSYERYEKPEKKVPPVVISHGTYKFEYSVTSKNVRGTAYSGEKKIGAWNFSLKTGTYRLASPREQNAPFVSGKRR